MNITPTESIDWFRILTDLCADGGSLYQVSRITSIPRSSLQSYKQGVEPSHSIGMCLLRLWSISTGKDRDEAPTIERMLSVSAAKRA
jgi:hypothetical protein